MNHRVLARAFQRILASSMTVSGGVLLVSCGGSATDTSGTGSQNDGASGADGSGGGGYADAPPPDATADDASSGDATMNDATAADGRGGDAPMSDAAATPDTNAGNDATSSDAHAAEAGSIDASIDARGDAMGVVVEAGSGDAGFIVTSCGMTVVPNPLSCYPVCFPLEAGALSAIDAGDSGLFYGVACNSLCGVGLWTSCAPIEDAGVSLIECRSNCIGRRPAGLLASLPGRGTMLGAHFAEMARLEAASVDAFRHLRRELVAHRAPRRLVRAAERAARDEIRHARMTRALAARYGGQVIAPRVEPRPVRSLEAIAVENATEGCVREAFGALVAHWQAAEATDPVVRAAMARIARDETRHAALAFEVDAWIRGRLGRAAQARVAAVRDRALDELASDEAEAPAALRSTIGLPTRSESRRLLAQLAHVAA